MPWECAFQGQDFLALLSIVPSSSRPQETVTLNLLVLDGGKKLAIGGHNSSDFLGYLLRKAAPSSKSKSEVFGLKTRGEYCQGDARGRMFPQRQNTRTERHCGFCVGNEAVQLGAEEEEDQVFNLGHLVTSARVDQVRRMLLSFPRPI